MGYYSLNRPRRDGRLSWPCWLTDSGRLTHKVVTACTITKLDNTQQTAALSAALSTVQTSAKVRLFRSSIKITEIIHYHNDQWWIEDLPKGRRTIVSMEHNPITGSGGGVFRQCDQRITGFFKMVCAIYIYVLLTYLLTVQGQSLWWGLRRVKPYEAESFTSIFTQKMGQKLRI